VKSPTPIVISQLRIEQVKDLWMKKPDVWIAEPVEDPETIRTSRKDPAACTTSEASSRSASEPTWRSRKEAVQKRELGERGLEVSVLGLGCMGMSFAYGPPKDKQPMTALLRTLVGEG
jgi:hypothetical protein